MSASSVPTALRGRAVRLAPAIAAMALALTPATAAPDPGHQKGHGGPPGQAAAAPRVPPGALPGDGGSPGVPGAPAVDAGQLAKDADKAAKEQAKAAEHTAKQAAEATRHAVEETQKAAKDAEKAARQAEKAAAKQANDSKKGAGHAAGQAQAAAAAAAPAASPPVNPADSATAAPLPTPAAAPAPAVTRAPAPAAETPSRAPARRPAPGRRARRRAAGTVSRLTPASRATPVRAPTVVTPARPPARHAPAKTKRAARHRPAATPLTRRVVRVLEVIPPRLRLAIALLAALGLLLAAAAAMQTVRARRLGRQRRLLAADVGLLQSALLPVLPGRIGDVRVSAAYRPAEGLAAGGDFYDAFELGGGRTAILVGDVAGHGRDVVPLTALVRYSIRAYLDAGLAPRTALQVAAAVLEPQLGERLVTVIVAVVDPAAGRLTYACAGHPPPLLRGENPDWVTASSSPPIGAGVPTGRRQTTVGLAQGDVACFTTDGLADARVERGRLGTAEVNGELASLPHGSDAEALLGRVVARTTSQPDDMAVCLVGPVVGPAAVGAERLEELEVDLASLSDGRAGRFLAACGVLPDTADEVVRQARGAIARTGSAVLAVRCGGGPARVKVAPRPPVALPLAPVGVAA